VPLGCVSTLGSPPARVLSTYDGVLNVSALPGAPHEAGAGAGPAAAVSVSVPLYCCGTAPANMHAITRIVPGGGFVKAALSPVLNDPLSLETVVPSGITTVTIRSLGPS
jgi:hypothetical protein